LDAKPRQNGLWSGVVDTEKFPLLRECTQK
jgi:hypothetical protein